VSELGGQNRRARSFGDAAADYDRSRPGYPPALVDWLAGGGGLDVVDAGCGTGKLGCLLAARGCRVLGVEPDERMADVARGHGIDVEVSTFEGWDAGDRRFDLVTAAQAWHWIDPEAGARNAAAALRPGGRFVVVWNLYGHDDDALQQLRAVYDAVAPELSGSVVLGIDVPEERLVGIDETGVFGPQSSRRDDWDRRYTSAEWVAQLRTHSDHHVLDPTRREPLLAAVSDAVDAMGGLTVRFSTLSIWAERAQG